MSEDVLNKRTEKLWAGDLVQKTKRITPPEYHGIGMKAFNAVRLWQQESFKGNLMLESVDQHIFNLKNGHFDEHAAEWQELYEHLKRLVL